MDARLVATDELMKMRFNFLFYTIVTFLFSMPLLAESSASGGFHADVAAGTMNVEFSARSTDSSGGATGQMTLHAPVVLPEDEDDPFGISGSQNLLLKVDIDCLRVSGRRASMSGAVVDANVPSYAGRRVLLTVEDGGEGANAAPDGFTWGFYAGAQSIKWFPSDAEREFDDGWKLVWTASDAEREDDRGVVINHDDSVTKCSTFGLAAYDLVFLPRGSGNIQVRP